MRTEPAQCPVCEARADVTRLEDGGDYDSVSCWQCGCFKISGSARVTFNGLPIEARRSRLDEAKRTAQSGQVPEVTA
jgi:hypothetical protein